MELKKEIKKKKIVFKKITFKMVKEFFISLGKVFEFFFRFVVLLFFVFILYLLDHKPKQKLDKPLHKVRKNSGRIKAIYMKIYNKVVKIFDISTPQEMKYSDLILLALKNLSTKKNRTYVTIIGMAIGFGSVILLLSMGYGFEKLVVSQVASLSEMQQIDVNTSQGSPLSFSADTIQKLNDIDGVNRVIPIITSVSKVTYNDAISDIIVYGVPSEYFEETDTSVSKGTLFNGENADLSEISEDSSIGVVAGASSIIIGNDSFNEEIYKVTYSIYPQIWKPVYETPSEKSKIIGYTKRASGEQEASEVWGNKYDDKNAEQEAVDTTGKEYSKWVEDTFELWNKKDCSLKDPDCIDKKYVVSREDGYQKVHVGYITESDITLDRYQIISGSSLETYLGKTVEDISFGLNKGMDTKLYYEADEDGGATVLVGDDSEKKLSGKLVYGKYYDANYAIENSNNTKLGYWIKTDIKVWGSLSCQSLCGKYSLTSSDDNTNEITMSVYIKLSDARVSDSITASLSSSVLGAETTSDDSSFIDLGTLEKTDDSIDWVSIASELGATETVDTETKSLPATAQMVAVVNTSMLTLLGIDINDAVGEKFTTTFIYDSKLFDKTNYTVESEEGTFEIIGVISDTTNTAAFYVPFNSIRVDGIVNASQVKVIVENTNKIEEIRKSIESLGLQTTSIVDTVDSISTLFHTLRIALLVLGLIALGVASLGMFNTLTVSLLEKTREIGLLKTMGLKASEIKALFLAESIIMSMMGGILGLLVGFISGKLISFFISILAVTQGKGILDVTYIPALLGGSMVFLSFVVGLITGWYPAKRATKISALDALRYE